MTTPTKKNYFNYVGDFGQRICKYLIRKVDEAVADGVPALNADFEWKTFQAEEPTLIAETSAKHPPPAAKADDTTLKARDNLHRGVERIIKFLKGEDHGK